MDFPGADIDLQSFELGKFCGVVAAMCEMARNESKDLSLSDPFPPDAEAYLSVYLQEKTGEYGVFYYLEKDLMLTDLFGNVQMEGQWVYLIYKKRSLLETYFHLKTEESELKASDRYLAERRRDLAYRYGRLLGYSEGYLSDKLG